jgi:hypothetical protein
MKDETSGETGGGVRQELTEEEARGLLNNRIPETIRDEYGRFVRAFLVKMADGKSVCLIVLERGYFVQFNQDPEKARERGIAASLALYASPETAFALATLYALFGGTLRDERLFWEKIDPAQGAALLETLGGVKSILEEEGGAHARAGELREEEADAEEAAGMETVGETPGKPAPNTVCHSCKRKFYRELGDDWECPHCGSLVTEGL